MSNRPRRFNKRDIPPAVAGTRLLLFVRVGISGGLKVSWHAVSVSAAIQGLWPRHLNWLERRLLVNGYMLLAGSCRRHAAAGPARAQENPFGSHLRPHRSLPPWRLQGSLRLCHIRTIRTISRRRFAYQNGVECRQRLDWTHNGIFQTEVPPRLGQRGVFFFPFWVHNVS